MNDYSIFIDHQIFDSQRVGGVSRIFAELMRKAEGRYRAEVGVEASRNKYLLADGVPEGGEPVHTPVIGKGRQLVYKALRRHIPTRQIDELAERNREYGLKRIRGLKPSVFVPSYYEPYVFSEGLQIPVVSTLFDMIPEKYPEFFVGNDKHSQWKRGMIAQSDRVVAISESAKRDLVDFWDFDADKVDVAYLGNSFSGDRASTGSGRPIAAPYLLYVGTRRGYKNFYFMVEALAPYLRRETELHLLCIGEPLTKGESEFLDARGLAGRVEAISASDEVLGAAYAHAECMVFPSQAEGFGLPIVEALSFGCPVAASRIPVFEEIAGNRIEYFDPKDPVELRQVIEKSVQSGRGDDGAVALRKQQAAEFTWERTADRYAEAFSKVL